jgi:hypothetical protein
MASSHLRLAFALLSTIPACASADFKSVVHAYPDGRAAPYEIFFSGEITTSTTRQFLDLVLSQKIEKATVYFDSIGGDLISGMEFGEQIRKAGFNTAIGKMVSGSAPGLGKCQSSCVLSYVGGYFRFAEPGSNIGIHRFYRRTAGEQDLDEGQILSAAITSYLTRMGTDPKLFERMVQVERGRMQTLSLPDAAKLKVFNNGVLPAEWKIEGKSGQVYLRGTQESWLGTGKILMSCNGGGNGVSLSALYDAGANTDRIAKESVSYSLRLDSLFLPVPAGDLRRRPAVQGEYLLATYSPTPPVVQSIEQARKIGFAFHPKTKNEFFGFMIDAEQERDTINSFIQHCRTK